MKKNKGFTLIELLIVIAIIGILAAVVLIAINPVEMMRRGRDSQRLSDMTQLRKAVDLFVADNQLLLDSTAGGPGVASSAGAGNRAVDGTGWVNLNVSTTLATLPVDPTHAQATSWAADPVNGLTRNFHYYYYADATPSTYELNCYLESATNTTKLTADGGDSDNVFEVGTDAGLNFMTDPGV